MRTHRPSAIRTTALAIGASALMLASCGGDDSADADAAVPPPVEVRETSEDTAEPAEQPAIDPACPPTELTFSNETADRSGTVTNALARSTFDGGLYEVHIADFDVTPDDLRSWRPVVPEDGNVITVQLSVFNATSDPVPVEPGASLELTIDPDVPTFLVRHFSTDEDWSTTSGIGVESFGTLDVIAVGDAFCFEIDYRDQDKQVSGTVAAPVFERR